MAAGPDDTRESIMSKGVSRQPGAGIEAAYREAFSQSARLYERACRHLPGGVSSTLRQHKPFPVYIERAAKSRKWTVEGRELIDYWVGHSALIHGHNPPALTEAVRAQLDRGTHFGAVAIEELEVAEWITRLVPSAERVRFIGTGSEAVHLALRLARVATGRTKFIKFEGHYHGWHDDVARAMRPPWDAPMSAGVPTNDAAGAVIVAPNDLAAVEQAFANSGDIASILLEPHGGYGGLLPTDPHFVAGLRRLATTHGAILIFDETVTGFRYAPGGYEEVHGVRPDLTIFGKTLFGGYPGAALAGREDVLAPTAAQGTERYVYHGGTWNAFNLSMAAGAVNLALLADGSVQRRIGETATRLRRRVTEEFRAHGHEATVHGCFSTLIFFSPYPEASQGAHRDLLPVSLQKYPTVRQALLLEGIDVPRFPCTVSVAHADDDIEETGRAFGRALHRLKQDGVEF
jgi:glutamate-1-semialdehyde 2,1-aminomutase